MNTVTSRSNQTVFDIALRELGDPGGVFDILSANAFLRLDYALPSGVVILIPDGAVIRKDIVDYYQRNSIYPATGDGQLAVIPQENMVRIDQQVSYLLAGGSVAFNGERLYNLREMLSVQVNFTHVSLAATAYVEQSLDGINYNEIPEASKAIPTGDGSITFNINGLVTDYCRVRIELAGSTSGTIDSIYWRI